MGSQPRSGTGGTLPGVGSTPGGAGPARETETGRPARSRGWFQGPLCRAHSRYLSRNSKLSVDGQRGGGCWPKAPQQVGDLTPNLGLGLSPRGAKNILPLGDSGGSRRGPRGALSPPPAAPHASQRGLGPPAVHQCRWTRPAAANWPPELNLACQHVVFGLREGFNFFFKHLSQRLKIGSVYILKSVFLAPAEILADLATPAHIPTWHQLGRREASSCPLQRHLGGPPLSTEQRCHTLGWPHQPEAWGPAGGGACLRSPRGEACRAGTKCSYGDSQASHLESCHHPPEACCRAPSPPLLAGHWPAPPARFCPLCSQGTLGSSRSHSSTREPWYQVCDGDGVGSRRPSTVMSHTLDSEGSDQSPP